MQLAFGLSVRGKHQRKQRFSHLQRNWKMEECNS